jgi:hypothetical protein
MGFSHINKRRNTVNLTNKFNLPAPVFKAIEWQEKSHKSNADISCTGLIDSPLRFWLGKKYYDQLEEDASDRLWALYGSLVHLVAEKYGKEVGGAHVEKQVIADVLGWKVSAILDYVLEGAVLSDYKFTSVWATMNGVKPEWESQLNVGLWLMRHGNDEAMAKIGATIKRLEICALFRDWVPANKDRFPNKVEVLKVKVWSDKDAQAYIEKRVALHQAAAKVEGVPPCCTDEERWMSDFAVCLNSKKTALKAKIKTREEAEHWKTELGADYIREAKPRRCEEYCTYAKCGFCPWFDYESKTTRTEPVVADVISGTAADTDSRNRKDGPNV